MKGRQVMDLILQMHEENYKMRKLINKDTNNFLNLEMLYYIKQNKALIKEVLCEFESYVKYGDECDMPKITGETIINYKGHDKSVAEWSKEVNIPRYEITRRIRTGWTVEKTLETPIRQKHSVIKELLDTEQYYVTKERGEFAYRFHFPRLNKTIPIKHYVADKYIKYIAI